MKEHEKRNSKEMFAIDWVIRGTVEVEAKTIEEAKRDFEMMIGEDIMDTAEPVRIEDIHEK